MHRFSWIELRGSLDRRLLSILLAALIGITLSSADQSLFSYAIPEITRAFSAPLEVIGKILSLSFFVASIAVVLLGMAADEFGRRGIFVIVIALSAVCVGGHALAPNLATLATLRIVGFAIGAAVFPLANTIVLEAAPRGYRGFLAGLLQIGYPLGFAAASLFVAPLLATHGWRSIFLAGFAVAVFAPLLVRLLPDSVPKSAATAQRRPGDAFARIGRLFATDLRRSSLVCMSGGFLICFAIGSTTYFLPTWMVESHGATPADASAVIGASYAIGVLGYIAAAYIGEFVTTRRNTLALWTFAGALAFALTLWCAAGRNALLLGLGLSIMFFYGTEAVRMPMIGELYPAELRATATAVTGSLAVTIASLVCPLVVTALAPRLGWAVTFTWCAVVPLILGGAMFLALRDPQEDPQAELIDPSS